MVAKHSFICEHTLKEKAKHSLDFSRKKFNISLIIDMKMPVFNHKNLHLFFILLFDKIEFQVQRVLILPNSGMSYKNLSMLTIVVRFSQSAIFLNINHISLIKFKKRYLYYSLFYSVLLETVHHNLDWHTETKLPVLCPLKFVQTQSLYYARYWCIDYTLEFQFKSTITMYGKVHKFKLLFHEIWVFLKLLT